MALILEDPKDPWVLLNKESSFKSLDDACSNYVQKGTRKTTDVSSPSLPELFSHLKGIQDVKRLFAR